MVEAISRAEHKGTAMFIFTIFSIVFGLILLSLFAVPLAQGQKPKSSMLLIGAPALLIGWPLCWFPPLALLYLLLAALFCVDAYWALGKKTYLTAACLIAILVYAGVALLMWSHLAGLREQFRFESMEARLGGASSVTASRGKPAADANLATVEQAIEEIDSRSSAWRTSALGELHGNKVVAFVNSPGFGVLRMPDLDYKLRSGMHAETTLPQPAPKKKATGSYVLDAPVVPVSSEFLKLHHDSYLDFTYPEGFGYFKDRRQVAGFRPHQFRRVPAAQVTWKVETLELIGLVVHRLPIAYVSDMLPRMDLLRKAPTRPLDTFETAALAELRAGKTLATRDQNERVRMVGAIRATKHCTACHACERGELLGAFSYVLQQL